MVLKILKEFSQRIFAGFFRKREDIKIGFYGPPNAGKTSLANRICKDWTGEEIGKVSNIPHETRKVQFKEVDTPGIATKIDYEDFLKYGLKKNAAKKRAKEATQGIIDSIKWLDDVEAVIIVLDACVKPYSQVNITIIGNLVARK